VSNDKKIARGTVTGSVFGLCTNVAYEDGCQRPGDKNLVTGSVVISEALVVNGICEHTVLKVCEPKTVEVREVPKPQPKRQVIPVQPVAVTVDQIVRQAEQRKAQPRLAVPKEDAPVSADVIEAAKRPPKLRNDLSTAPAAIQAVMRLPVDARFDDSLDGYTQEEIDELMDGPREVEPIASGSPMNPFDSNFVVERPSAPQQQQVPRRGNRPVSKFDL
jgi:hypothetical protein